jgi:hypothetical protein
VYDDVWKLTDGCKRLKCSYLLNKKYEDYDPPPGCVLMVAALFAAKREEKQE